MFELDVFDVPGDLTAAEAYVDLPDVDDFAWAETIGSELADVIGDYDLLGQDPNEGELWQQYLTDLGYGDLDAGAHAGAHAGGVDPLVAT